MDGHEVDRAAVVIIDVSMPGMDGFELHTLLQASGRNIPTTFFPARTRKKYEARAESMGAVTFHISPATKPIYWTLPERQLGHEFSKSSKY